MAARFRIDQTGPGNGTLDRSRTDLVDGQVINLVVPSPVVGATYSWEIIYKFGATASLTASTGTSTSIGPGGSVSPFSAFLIQLTETIGPNSTRRQRIAAVRGTKGFRPLVFGETANPNSSRTTRNPDDSTDNEVRTNLDSVSGDNSQSWTGWIEAMNEALEAFENYELPIGIRGEEGLEWLTGVNGYELEEADFTPAAPSGNVGLIYTRDQGGVTHLFYRGTNDAGAVCLSDGSLGSGVTGGGTTTDSGVALWDGVDGSAIKDSVATIEEEATIWLIRGLHSFEFALLGIHPDSPAGGGRLYALTDGAYPTDDLHYLRSSGDPVRLTVPGSTSVHGTATEGVLFSASDTVNEGWFARFDLTLGNCTATLNANIPIGGHCVVKIEGAAGGNQLDIVDGAAQNIDGVATYTLNTNNASVRLTKMENGAWAVG